MLSALSESIIFAAAISVNYIRLFNISNCYFRRNRLKYTRGAKDEKYYNLNQSLPTDSTEIGSIKSGDIMLYGSNCVVLFYDSFQTQYSYTKIGFIENTYNLAEAVGNGNITITFEK